MRDCNRVEKFDSYDLGALRSVLMQADIDSFQASEVLAAFLNGRGYGVDARLVQDAVIRMEDGGCDAAAATPSAWGAEDAEEEDGRCPLP